MWSLDISRLVDSLNSSIDSQKIEYVLGSVCQLFDNYGYIGIVILTLIYTYAPPVTARPTSCASGDGANECPCNIEGSDVHVQSQGICSSVIQS